MTRPPPALDREALREPEDDGGEERPLPAALEERRGVEERRVVADVAAEHPFEEPEEAHEGPRAEDDRRLAHERRAPGRRLRLGGGAGGGARSVRGERPPSRRNGSLDLRLAECPRPADGAGDRALVARRSCRDRARNQWGVVPTAPPGRRPPGDRRSPRSAPGSPARAPSPSPPRSSPPRRRAAPASRSARRSSSAAARAAASGAPPRAAASRRARRPRCTRRPRRPPRGTVQKRSSVSDVGRNGIGWLGFFTITRTASFGAVGAFGSTRENAVAAAFAKSGGTIAATCGRGSMNTRHALSARPRHARTPGTPTSYFPPPTSRRERSAIFFAARSSVML